MKRHAWAFIMAVTAVALALNLVPSRTTYAQEQCLPATVTFIARDSKGAFVPDINFSLYQRLLDVDNKPKPGAKMVTGKVSAILGRGVVSFVPKLGDEIISDYAIQVWDKNPNVGEFWFYSELSGVTCGGKYEVTVTVSAIHITLRDTQQVLRKSTNFSLYTQKQDADGKPIKDKLVAVYTTSTTGDATTYVADASHFMSGMGTNLYAFEVTGVQGGVFNKYDISVNNASTTDIIYVFSDLALTVMDINRVPYPANTKVEVFKQAYDNDKQKIFGTKVRDVKTNDKGIAVFENPYGMYAARVLGDNGLYTNFWELNMQDQQRVSIVLQTGSDFTTTPGACAEPLEFSVVARNSDDEFVPGISFELYYQSSDANGNPVAGSLAVSGKIGSDGRGAVVFNPDPTKTYVLKMYDRNSRAGEFWFFDNMKFTCGQSKEISKLLSSIKFIIRDGAGDLLTNLPVSLYTQKYDIDGNPRAEKKDLVANLNTGAEGYAVIYVAPNHPYDKYKRGVYTLSVKRGNVEYLAYGIGVSGGAQTLYQYTLSDAVFDLQDADGNSLSNKALLIYRQTTDAKGKPARSTQVLASIKTNSDGVGVLAAPGGTYVAVYKEGSQEIVFWNLKLENNKRLAKDLVTPLVQLTARDSTDVVVPEKTQITAYNLLRDYKTGYYYRSTRAAGAALGQNGYANMILSPGPYVFSVKIGTDEYVQPGYVQEAKLLSISIIASTDTAAANNTKFKVGGSLQPVSLNQSGALQDRLKGYILLQVESKGEAWYLYPKSQKRFYLKDGPAAYDIMRKLGVGATNTDLAKIPVGLDDRMTDTDTDSDGLPDKLEQALGTDPKKADTDGDSANDGVELKSGSNPLGTTPLKFDTNLVKGNTGVILLQVQSRGEAWYVNPKDGKRYYMADGPAAYKLMRFLSLGIKNSDLQKIKEDKLQ